MKEDIREGFFGGGGVLINDINEDTPCIPSNEFAVVAWAFTVDVH